MRLVAFALGVLLAAAACAKSAPLPPECEEELRLMTCVAEHLTPGPTRPDVRATRVELEQAAAAKGATAVAERCKLDTQSLRLTSGAMCGGGG